MLAIEFDGIGTVSCPGNQVTITLTETGQQQNFGNILLGIHRTIDKSCPDRREDVYILVCYESGSFKNLIKIWKTV